MTASRKFWLAAVLTIVPVLGVAKDLEIASVWAAAPVKVDGSADTWSTLAQPLGDIPMVMGVQNDQNYLYLFLKTSDQRIRTQLERIGITVWANGEGKTEKGFGVRFPLGTGRQRGQRGQGGAHGRAPQPEGGAPGTNTAQPEMSFEVIGPTEKDRRQVQPAADQPIAASISGNRSATVVEFRIPLKGTEGNPLAVGAGPGATIALGLVTERPAAPRGPDVQAAGPPVQAGEAEGGAPARVQGGSAPSGPETGQAEAAAGALAGDQAGTAPAAPGSQAGAVPTPQSFGVGAAAFAGPAAGQGGSAPASPGAGHAGGRYGHNPRGGRDMVSAVNLWVRVALATQPPPPEAVAPADQAPAPNAEEPVPPAQSPVPAEKESAPPAATPAPPKME